MADRFRLPRRGVRTDPADHRVVCRVLLHPIEREMVDLAAQVRVWRERGQVVEPGRGSLASASQEVGLRIGPGLMTDVLRWADDPSLPQELRQKARRLTQPPPEE